MPSPRPDRLVGGKEDHDISLFTTFAIHGQPAFILAGDGVRPNPLEIRSRKPDLVWPGAALVLAGGDELVTIILISATMCAGA